MFFTPFSTFFTPFFTPFPRNVARSRALAEFGKPRFPAKRENGVFQTRQPVRVVYHEDTSDPGPAIGRARGCPLAHLKGPALGRAGLVWPGLVWPGRPGLARPAWSGQARPGLAWPGWPGLAWPGWPGLARPVRTLVRTQVRTID